MFAPRSVLEAMRIAKLQERSLQLLKKAVPAARSYSNWSDKKAVQPAIVEKKAFDKKPAVENTQKSILGKPNYAFQKKLTPKEMDEHRAQGLCFFCHEKYERGHDCPQRKKTQVFLMEVLNPEEEDDLDDLEEDAGTEVINPTVSLNALHGDSQSPMMRMIGW